MKFKTLFIAIFIVAQAAQADCFKTEKTEVKGLTGIQIPEVICVDSIESETIQEGLGPNYRENVLLKGSFGEIKGVALPRYEAVDGYFEGYYITINKQIGEYNNPKTPYLNGQARLDIDLTYRNGKVRVIWGLVRTTDGKNLTISGFYYLPVKN